MKKAGDILKEILEGYSENAKYIGVFKEWERLVGRDIAAHAKIRDIENYYILVDTDHQGWMQRLQMKERQIVREIAGRYPELKIKGLKLFLKTIDNPK